jgi:two-component system, NarL family, sensor kinase
MIGESVPGTSTRRRALATSVAVTVWIAVILGYGTGSGSGPDGTTALLAPVAVAYTATGALVLSAIPRHLMGWLMVAAGAAATIAMAAQAWSAWLPLAWLSQWAWWPPLGLIVLALLVFPDGRLPSPRGRLLALVVAAATVVASAAIAAAAVDRPRGLLTQVIPLPAHAHLLLRVAAVAILVVGGGLVAVIVGLWARWRRAEGDIRAQIACLLAAGALMVLGSVLNAVNLPGTWVFIGGALPLGMTVAVLRYRLYGLDRIIHRGLVWLVMTLLVIAGFVALVALTRDVVVGSRGSSLALVATGLIAVTFDPVRRRVQRAVDRLLYGDRDDPYEVIARLAELQRRTIEPNDVLPLLTSSIASSLQVPYVAVELDEPGGPHRVAEHGDPCSGLESFGMISHGERIGRLLVATRSPSAHFSPAERRLLRNAAVQAGVAAEATRLIRDLQQSRERLVMSREEERRRLRRDLHDGLGPSLAGVTMQVGAARKLLGGDTRPGQILGSVAEDLRGSTQELRRLVDELRPPPLDRGLEAGLRAECRRFDSTVPVDLRIDGDLRGLPAAVEVAVYRIVAEALANVARHAHARTCRVGVRRRRALTLEIADDGVGVTGQARRGVGLDSMRERVEELRGEFDIVPGHPRGTTIKVRLPVPAAARPGGG